MNGQGVPYHLVGDNPEEMYEDFAYKGAVRVYGKATFDENLGPTRIDISQIERIQGILSLSDAEAGE